MIKSIPMDLVEGTTTFTLREEGVPSELLASPNGREATLPSTSIERQEIAAVKGPTAPDKASVVDEGASQSATASVSMSTAMHRMVDNLVDGEEEVGKNNNNQNIVNGSGAMMPSYPTSTDWDFQDVGNDTSYGLIGTLTAHNLLQELPITPSAQQLYRTTGPILPSIYNTPFAPLPSDATPSPQSRPSTATRVPGHSKQNSGNVFPLQPQANGWSVHSSNFSSMPDPSSMVFPNTPVNGTSTTYQPHLGNGTFGAGSAFNGSAFFTPSVSTGSPWASGSARNGTDSQMEFHDEQPTITTSGQEEGIPKHDANVGVSALKVCKRCGADTFRSNNELHKHLKTCKGKARGRNVQATPPNGQGG